MDNEVTTIPILSFSGKEEEWERWSKKFMAMAQRRKYHKVLKGLVNIPAEDDDELTEEQLKIREANERAYSDRLLTCNDDVSFGIIENSVTSENPSGDASLA